MNKNNFDINIFVVKYIFDAINIIIYKKIINLNIKFKKNKWIYELFHNICKFQIFIF